MRLKHFVLELPSKLWGWSIGHAECCCHPPEEIGDIIVFAHEADRNAPHDCYPLNGFENFGRFPESPKIVKFRSAKNCVNFWI